jgi:hypothetical protein
MQRIRPYAATSWGLFAWVEAVRSPGAIWRLRRDRGRTSGRVPATAQLELTRCRGADGEFNPAQYAEPYLSARCFVQGGMLGFGYREESDSISEHVSNRPL